MDCIIVVNDPSQVPIEEAKRAQSDSSLVIEPKRFVHLAKAIKSKSVQHVYIHEIASVSEYADVFAILAEGGDLTFQETDQSQIEALLKPCGF